MSLVMASHALTAPWSKELMNLRWNIRKRTSEGVMMISAEALIRGMLIQY
jgi:hypothetical protein